LTRPSFILIWGISGAGKSRYCHWLAERGYLHLDNDTIAQRLRDRTASQIEQLWMRMRVEQVPTRDFVEAITNQKVVAEFGARPDERSLVQLRLLIDLGASAWWFDGDRASAFGSWQDRDVPVDDEFWRIQLAWVDAAWPTIAEILRSHMVRTIGPDRAYLREADIDRLMFGDSPDQDDRTPTSAADDCL
jgi:hypothetical protein